MDIIKFLETTDIYSYNIGYGDRSKIGLSNKYGNGSGDGCGDNCGDSYLGDGYGSGHGNSYGYGHGGGDGNGDVDDDGGGWGRRCGFGTLSINNNKIYLIDGVQTIIKSIKGNVAKGFIVNRDFTLTPTFIVKEFNYFAHGESLHEAFSSLQSKISNRMSIGDKIIKFKEKFNDFSKEYPNKDLFEWHHIITGSCKQGRMNFAKNNNIDIENGSMTIYDFIKLTKNSYNGNLIKKLIK